MRVQVLGLKAWGYYPNNGESNGKDHEQYNGNRVYKDYGDYAVENAWWSSLWSLRIYYPYN